MNYCRPEVADVFREYGEAYIRSQPLSAQQRKVLEQLAVCRTAALGGHKLRCDRCAHEEISYNSCRNRHCPKCQAGERARWLEERRRDLLAVPYFHVVFTLPDEIGPLALQNKAQLYGLLFQAASQTLQTIAADKKHLGARLGFSMVLHTWGQTLRHHPHIHCVVPAGGISLDEKSWVACHDDFFLPVRVLARLFRGKYLAGLDALRADAELKLCGRLQELAEPRHWRSWLQKLYEKEWVVYSKPPFGGPERVLKYLARYTNRVAISNARLVSLAEGKVCFRWKDYARGNVERTMMLPASEFIRRFLLHVLPKGFVRIRHYGFLSNRARKQAVPRVRELIALDHSHSQDVSASATRLTLHPEEQDPPQQGLPCPACGQGRLLVVAELPPCSNAALSTQVRAPP